MANEARRERLLEAVRQHGSITLSAFALKENVSEMTVRRDARDLERGGLVERFHGGLRLASSTGAATTRSTPITVGLVVPDPNYYFPEIVAGATGRAAAANTKVRLGVSRYTASTELKQVHALLRSRVDALIIAPTQPSESSLSTLLTEARVPTVILERLIEPLDGLAQFDSIRSDHVGGAIKALRYLQSFGHRKIALLASSSPTTTLIEQGFLLNEPPHDVSEPLIVPPGDLDSEGVSQWIDRMLTQGATAFIAHSDRLAFELMDQLAARGVTVPADVSVIAYDDEYVGMAPQPITAVAPAKRLLGSMAIDMVRAQVDGRQESLHVTVMPALHTRTTVGEPRDQP
ncbi:substrate-binding domain-containing protein [Curtobacterium poinsettiae]|uniref:substrate-binding domain-containing protein n=1 Tax=Curtobacterium poinsettiae TaxID=159612 RepID=UPI0023608935|nr:substrate-binding domain-containing protein [Curtobacterium flaccumfaciens]MDD1386785.1 substrate-binding domain-containing protein [Curtobacterium flaccumfaciens pv. poinsettiae]